jgi:ABC-type sulfate transport system substrate-binding protein
MIQKGTLVKWSWGNGSAEGNVEETYTSKITKTIKGSEVTRNGKRDNKALYIKQDDGDYVLKSENEVERLD